MPTVVSYENLGKVAFRTQNLSSTVHSRLCLSLGNITSFQQENSHKFSPLSIRQRINDNLEKVSPFSVDTKFSTRTGWSLQSLVPKWGFVLKTLIQVLTLIQPPHGVALLEDRHLNQYGPTASWLQKQTHRRKRCDCIQFITFL